MTAAAGQGALESTQQSVLTALQGSISTTTTITNDGTFAKESGGNLAAAKTDLDTIVTNTTGLATQSTLSSVKSDLDTIVTQTATPNVSDRWARQVGQVDIARVNGATYTQSNPVITESNIQNWVRNGQGFCLNGRGVTATNANLVNCALSIFNPSNSGKNVLIFSLRAMVGSTGGNVSSWTFTTTDPFNGTGFTHTLTPVHLPGATSPATVVSACNTTSGNTASVSAPGTLAEEFLLSAQVSSELLSNNATILLPPGNGIAVMIFVGTTGNYYQSFAKWVEY